MASEQKNSTDSKVQKKEQNTCSFTDIEPRVDLGKDIAKQKAEMFLQRTFGADLDRYDFHEEKIKRYENRIEYVFSWEKKNVYVPWKEGQGGGKLLTEVTVAGDEIREFYKNKFDLPDKFLIRESGKVDCEK